MSSRARTLQKRILKTGGKSVKRDWFTQPEVIKASAHRKAQKRKGSLRGSRRGTRKVRPGHVDQGTPFRNPVNAIDVHKRKMLFKADCNRTASAGHVRWPRANGGLK